MQDWADAEDGADMEDELDIRNEMNMHNRLDLEMHDVPARPDNSKVPVKAPGGVRGPAIGFRRGLCSKITLWEGIL